MSANSSALALRRFLLTAVAVPAVVVAAALALQLAALPSLPDPVAVNWAATGLEGSPRPGFRSC